MISPGPAHAGHFDGDDIAVVARALLRAAAAAEPELTPVVRTLARATGGRLERLGGRVKTERSILEKLERFRRRSRPAYRLDRFNDAVRYTVVYPALIYWRAVEAAPIALADVGCEVTVRRNQWDSDGYRGVNVTVRSHRGFDFEIQFHTERSVWAAEQTHFLYEQARVLDQRSAEARRLALEAQTVWDRVPAPPGSPEVD